MWDGKTTRYVVDQVEELSRVLMELDENGTSKAYYVYGLGLIGREDAKGTYQSYHFDKRGSTTILSDMDGRVTDRYTYGVYGELEEHDGTSRQPFCYNGRDGVMTDPNATHPSGGIIFAMVVNFLMSTVVNYLIDIHICERSPKC